MRGLPPAVARAARSGAARAATLPHRLRAAATAVTLAVGGLLVQAPPAHASGTSTISGTVFRDLDRNGVQDAGETGFAGVRLTLWNSAGANIAATYTDAGGGYSFGGLADGTYTVAFDPTAWDSYRGSWVLSDSPTAPAPDYLRFQHTVTLSGTATAGFALRPIVRSTVLSSPISSAVTAGGTVVHSYDDAVTAQQIVTVLQAARLVGAEQPVTVVNFDYGTANETATVVTGTQGGYSNYSAQIWVEWTSWLDYFDDGLFHEYGHAWSEYCMYIVQQDAALTSYLTFRGLVGNPNLNTSHMWSPMEMIAEDYRQLFGSANAASYPQENTQIPAASQVPGLATFLDATFMQPPSASSVTTTLTAPAAPTVTSVSPAVGPAAGGTSVTVSGTNFTGQGWTVSKVTFAGVPATGVTVSSSSQLVAVAPPGAGVADIAVTTTSSTGTSVTSTAATAGRYSYAPAPTLTGLSPASGTLRGGTAVTITGTGFCGPGFTTLAVSFGSRPASFTVSSCTAIVATSPASKTAQAMPVTVTTPGGAAGAAFTYTRR